MLLMVEGIRAGIWQAIYQYVEANKKCTKDYENK